MAKAFDVDGNSLSLLTHGPERLDALVALIDGARTSLKLLYYMYAEDDAGKRVHNALLASAARNVKIALIVDGFGSDATAHDEFFKPLKAVGIDVCAFHPRWGRRYLLRNHQKMALADDLRAIVGGFNVAADYFSTDPETAWRDLGLMVDGEAATRLSGYFDALQRWTKQPKSKMRDLRTALRRWSNPKGNVRWLLGGPVRKLSPWARSVRDDMKSAKSLSMIAAYFAPNPAMLRRLDHIGQTGDARVITASKSDNTATVSAARFTYPGLLRKGVRIFEYEPSRLHTKLILIDDLVYIGSANFDMRSLFLNLEIMLRIDDPAFAAHVRAYIDGELADSDEQFLAAYTGWRTWVAKSRRALSYFVVAVMDYNVARRLNFGAE
jgi:cardiolipin synthase A/B